MIKQVPITEAIDLFAQGKAVKINTPSGFQPIGGIALKGNLDTIKVETSERHSITVTPDHRFFTIDRGDELLDPENDGSKVGSWVKAKELKIGDTILNESLVSESIVNLTKTGKEPIYDLYVDHPTHSFIGNGVVNHNTGKTLLALHALVETQRKNGIAVLIDAEFAFNPAWFRLLGGDPEELIHYEPDYIDQVYEFTKRVVNATRKKDTEIPITIVYDSVAASPSKKEFEGAEYDMGKRAQAHGRGLRMLMGLCKKQDVTFIAINQLRATMCVTEDTIVSWEKD